MTNIFYKNRIKIGCWNIQGIRDEKLSDKVLVDFINDNDCVILIESWLNSSINLINQYTYCQPALRSKRGRSKGGIIITMKDNVRRGVKIVESTNSHMVWLKFEKQYFKLEKDLYVCALYIPPIDSCKNLYSGNRYELFDLLEEKIFKYSEYGHIMLMGDVNSRIGTSIDVLEYSSDEDDIQDVQTRNSKDSITNQFGHRWLHICKQHNLLVLNGRSVGDLLGQCTSYHYNGSAVVDYCVISREFNEKVYYFTVLNPTHLSDHAPISVCIKAVRKNNVKCNTETTEFPRGFTWNEESYSAAMQLSHFRERLDQIHKVDYHKNSNGIESLGNAVVNVLIDAAKYALKRRKARGGIAGKVKTAKWYTSKLRAFKNDVLSAGKLLKKYPKDPHVRGIFMSKKKLYKKSCRQAKRSHMTNIAKELDKAEIRDPNEFWRFIKTLKHSSQSDQLPNIEDLVNTFKVHNQCDYKNESFDMMFMQNIENIVENEVHLKEINSLDKEISKDELVKAIRNLRCGKAFGLDLVTNEMLKTSLPFIVEPVLKLFNMCLELCIYPKEWCHGYIVPVYKSGTRLDPMNYRPITISSCLGKVFSSVLKNRINKLLDDNNIISNVQIGFSKGHRTSDHLLMLKGLIDVYKSKRKRIYSCFIDFSAAFDSVWHDGLVFKLRKANISSKIISLIQSMYNQIYTRVKRQNVISKQFKCLRGTRQGCNLSPTLFKIYLNDLQDIFNAAECDPVQIDRASVGCLMYADDVVILSESAAGLQRSLDKLNVYCKKWQLKLNLQKTKTMVFNCRKSCYTFLFDNKIVQDSNSVCYLGFMLTPSGKFTATQKYVYDKACRAVYSLRAALKGVLELTVNAQIKLFDSVIKPILLYGSEVWGAYVFKIHDNIQSLHNIIQNVTTLMEKVHSKMCKYILQVHKSASNYAVRCELGRLPLFINVACRILKYYINICDRKESSIVKTVFKLHESNASSWYTFIKSIVKHLGLNLNTMTAYSIKSSKNSVYNKLCKISQELYIKNLSEYSKLSLYASIKTKHCKEKYLNCIHDVRVRKSVSQLRLSCHKLPIETGRYKGIEACNRFCTMCNMYVGTEQHCLIECLHPTITAIRTKFLTKIFQINSQLKQLNRTSLFKYILLFTDLSINQECAFYVNEVFNAIK